MAQQELLSIASRLEKSQFGVGLTSSEITATVQALRMAEHWNHFLALMQAGAIFSTEDVYKYKITIGEWWVTSDDLAAAVDSAYRRATQPLLG